MDLEHYCILPTTNPTVYEFRDYVHHQVGDHLHKGLDGHNRTAPFICKLALDSFWTVDKIRSAITHDAHSAGGLDEIIASITTSHIKIFSILCYIGSPTWITKFTNRNLTDASLPLPQNYFTRRKWRRDITAEQPGDEQTQRLFLHRQWTFTPLLFSTDREISERRLATSQILPIRTIAKLHDDDGGPGNMGTALYRVGLYDCCAPLQNGEHKKTTEVVFKVFESRTRGLWENEAGIYTTLSQNASPDLLRSVTTCFGSFTLTVCGKSWPQELKEVKVIRGDDGMSRSSSQRKISLHSRHGDSDCRQFTQRASAEAQNTVRHIIVLEYAPGGSLTTFCNRNAVLLSRPGWEDRLSFWHQMFNILPGLEAAHKQNITHRDLNRANILYMGTPLHDIGVSCFKVADFGISRAGTRSGRPHEAEGCHLYNYRYLAPECCGNATYHHDRFSSPGRSGRYTFSADIWALGCILSEMLVRCSPLGEPVVKRYLHIRVEEIIMIQKRRGARPSPSSPQQCAGGFHDGYSGKRLASVDEMHRLALQGLPETDVLHVVSRIILDFMLQPRENRERFGAAEIRSLWLAGIGSQGAI